MNFPTQTDPTQTDPMQSWKLPLLIETRHVPGLRVRDDGGGEDLLPHLRVGVERNEVMCCQPTGARNLPPDPANDVPRVHRFRVG
jgi:hypothetical protein